MADLYAIELALTLSASTPEPVLALIREHMAPYAEDGVAEDGVAEDGDEGDDFAPPPFKVLAARGPAYRVGGECTAALTRTPPGWTLTARQEIHAESLPDAEQLLNALTPHLTTPEAPLGTLRFYEDPDPEPITADASGAVRLS
ncbi:hypothetical protein EF910_06795 [Streptomyces sp. WAC07149]|uniref:hypothetical protein n=1 Tax=Streptomyces sp. WAC07149 TaxID=2487425 RepID=UPI000F778786|nr:hypothetical protein [Streptomyces sp. WAC07149]RST07381.1 hypothetical protein EF910_06795 [Streptomyces sp. WAC07149]